MSWKKSTFTFITTLFVWMSSILATSDEPKSHKVRLQKAATKQIRIANPTSMAAGDFDQDGITDLVVATSSGTVTFYRRNKDTFLAVETLSMPEPADFVAAGDFDADGHLDFVTGAKGSTALHMASGNGGGSFGLSGRVDLTGKLTAMAAGEVNRIDGLNDLVAAIHGKNGPELLAFEGPSGALRSKPERLQLNSSANALAIADLNGDSRMDVVAASGTELTIISGRDRKLSADSKRRSGVPPPLMERLALPVSIQSMAAGNFTGDSKKEMALLGSDGNVIFLKKENQWKLTSGPREANSAKHLVSGRLSGYHHDDLVLHDKLTKRLNIVNEKEGSVASVEQSGEVLAVLPMRLNKDGIADLVVLSSTGIELVLDLPAHTFIVNSTADDDDFNFGDNLCDTDDSAGDGPCTLRAAIRQANFSIGDDEIQFSIGSGVQTIQPGTAYPSIIDTVTIDGSTQPGFAGEPLIEIDGSVVGSIDGLLISSNNCVIRGLVINRFGSGIHFQGIDGGFVESNYLGTGLDGTTDLGNASHGVYIRASSNVTVGGSSSERNVISGNDDNGIRIDGQATTNAVQGNYIGTNKNGNVALGNGNNGIYIEEADANTIGGTNASWRNIISGNASHGIDLDSLSTNNLIQNNYIGTDVTGSIAVPNGIHGIHNNSASTTIGGTTASARNVVSGNGGTGIEIQGSNAIIQGNYIGIKAGGEAALANNGQGITLAGVNNVLIGGVNGRNVISGNNAAGVNISNDSQNNFVQGNYIGTNAAGTSAKPNAQGVAIQPGHNNLIGGRTAAERNVISGQTNGPGVTINTNSSGNSVEGNYIGLNAAGTAALKNNDGIVIDNSNNNIVGGDAPEAGNIISRNTNTGVRISGNDSFDNQVLNNVIGLNSEKTAALPNAFGIWIINGAHDNTIGGAGMGNRMLGSTGGIHISDSGTSSNHVFGNWIGYPSGTTPKGFGIRIQNGSTGNQIGDVDPDFGNRIESNGGAGVILKTNSSDNNSIRGNSILNNGGLGIDLNGVAGVSPNDPGDGDDGPNDQMNFPVITSVIADSESTTIQGTLDTGCPDCGPVDFYVNTSVDPSGYGEGADYLGSVTPDSSGNFSAVLDAIGAGTFVTATATDGNGNTSEFSFAQQTVVTLPSLSISDVEVTEGNSGTIDANFTVTLSSASGVNVSVQYDTQDNSANGSDYNPVSDTLTIPAGQTTGTITVQVNGDTNNEPDENFFVILSNPFNATISDDQGVGNILNDDGLPSFSINDVAIAEGDTGVNLYFTVTLSPAAGTDVSVNYATANGSAIAPGDYTTSSGTVNIPAGGTEGIIIIPIAGDNASEGDEQFYVNLSNQTSGTVIADAQGLGVILESPDLVATALSSTSVQLTWTDPNEDEIGFKIQRSTNGTSFSQIATVGANVTTFTNTGRTPATLYYYRVLPYTSLSNAPASNTAAVTTFPSVAAKVCATQVTNQHTWARMPSAAWNGTKWGVVYQERTAINNDEIFFQLLNADGTTSGSPIQISNGDAVSQFPAIRWNGTNFGVVWNERIRGADGDLTKGSISFALLDANGNFVRKGVRVITDSFFFLNADVRFPFIWDGTNWGLFISESVDIPDEILFYRLEENGQIADGPINVSNTSGKWDGGISVAWNGTEYGLSWTILQDGTNEVVFQRMQPDGTLIGSRTSISTVVGTAQQTSVVWNGTDWTVAWDQQDVDGNILIYLQRLNSTGGLIGTPQQISDNVDPDFGLDDELPILFNKPGGGYLLYTLSFQCDNDFCQAYEVGRMEADSSGNRIGTRTFLSDADGINSGFPTDVAFDGSNFLVVYNDHRLGTQEVSDVVVDAAGSIVAGGAIRDLTTGHSPGGNLLATSPGNPVVIPFQSGFVAMWNETIAGPPSTTNQIYAKIYDGSGTNTATKFPLSTTNLRVRPAAVAVGNTFAVAWKVSGGLVMFARYDSTGNLIGSEVQVSTAGSGRPFVGLDFSGSEYGIAWTSGKNLFFQRISTDGTIIGSPVTVATVPDGNFQFQNGSPRLHWVGSGWAVIWGQQDEFYYARLDSTGAKIIAPQQFTFTGFPKNGTQWDSVWNGQVIGFAYTGSLGLDPPGQDIFFTTLDKDGNKQFEEVAVVSTFAGDSQPSLYWAGDRFKLAHFRGDNGGTIELDVFPNGTTGSSRVLAHFGGTPAAAYNGVTAGFLWIIGRGEGYFETTQCLTDVSAPSCPAASGGFDGTKVTINWSTATDAESGIFQYFIYRDGSVLNEAKSTTTSLEDFGWNNGSTHEYEVRAMNKAYLESTGCSTVSVPIGVSPPTGLSNNSAADLSGCADTGVEISWDQDPANWNDGGTGTRTYDVLRDDSPLVTGIAYGTTNYTDTTGTNGVLYNYKVTYNNGSGASATTSPGADAADTASVAPSGLTNNTATDLDGCADTGVQITWNQDPSDWGDGGTGTRTYDVFRDGSPISSGIAYGTTSFTDTTGTNGTNYAYTVRYNNGCSLSSTTAGASASDSISQTGNQSTNPLSKVNSTGNTTFTPAFTITTGQANSAVVNWTLTTTNGNDLTACAAVRLRAPDNSTETTLKAAGSPDTGTANVTSFYQTHGPGTYRIVLQELGSCPVGGTNTENARLSNSTMVVKMAGCP